MFWSTVRKKCSRNQEKILKFKAEGQEFAKSLRSFEQLVQSEQFLVTECLFVHVGFSALRN